MRIVHRSLATAVAVLAIAATAAVASAAPKPGAAADTWHQTIVFADGSSATATFSTRSNADPGSGVDLGASRSNTLTGSAGASVAVPAGAGVAVAPDAAFAAASGSQTMYGTVTYSNVGVTQWTYFEQVSWNYANYKVTNIYGQLAGSRSSCCLWGFQGNTSLSHDPAGSASFGAFAQGRYQNCILWACVTKSPWVRLRGNGNGVQTGFDWGIG
jgi:hypothetical protein